MNNGIGCNNIMFVCFQIYMGRYRSRREREAPIQMTDDFLDNLQAGCFVAMFFENYHKTPVIGKVKAVGETTFQVHYWTGTYGGKWSPQHLPRRTTEPWLEDLPKTCIVCCGFELTEECKLMPATKAFLKDRYAVLKNQH